MLGERIANLRKNKGISQEELADVLLTSRQAISKWERGESEPDIGRLKDLAAYFNVSIDYLLGYDLETTSVNSFIERVKKSLETGIFDISTDEIRMIVSRNSNNFNLILTIAEYLNDYYFLSHQDELIDLFIQYVKRAILLFQPDNAMNVTLNSLHQKVAAAYALKNEYELAKKYLKENRVIEVDELLSECEFELGHYKEAEKITSEIFYKSVSSLIGSNITQIRLFLRTNRIKEALDLTSWSIDFTKSVSKSEDVFLDVIYVFIFIKASCERTLGLNYSNSLKFLIDNRDNTVGFKRSNDGLRFYDNQHVMFTTEAGNIKDTLYKEIKNYKNEKEFYQNSLEVFNEVYNKE